MITFRSSTIEGSESQVYGGDLLIGYNHKYKSNSGDRYLASKDDRILEEKDRKDIESPNNALHWAEMRR